MNDATSVNVPETNWFICDIRKENCEEKDNLEISKDIEPEYFKEVTVLSWSGNENKHEELEGKYRMMTDKHNNKPVFRKRYGSLYYLFWGYDGFWFVGKEIGNRTGSSTVFGWKYSDASSIWPDINILHIVGRENLNIHTFVY